jgi:hypothetical protein
MRALVVYESMFGNTQAIARAIADGLGTRLEVEIVEVGTAPAALPANLDLLVVGGPTQAHGMTDPESRRSSSTKTKLPLVSTGIGIREWLKALGGGTPALGAAAFDTRLKGPGLLWGSAAKAADDQLRRIGLNIVAPPESFLIKGPLGPVHDVLLPGEADRARRWGEQLAAGLAVPAATK